MLQMIWLSWKITINISMLHMAEKPCHQKIYLTLSLISYLVNRFPYLNNTLKSQRTDFFYYFTMSPTFYCFFYAFNVLLYAPPFIKYSSSFTTYKILFHTSKPGSTTAPLENVPVNSRLDFVLTLMIELITGFVISLSLFKDRDHVWLLSRNTNVWHSPWNSGPQLFVIG